MDQLIEIDNILYIPKISIYFSKIKDYRSKYIECP